MKIFVTNDVQKLLEETLMSNTPSTVSALIKVLKVEQVRGRELIASNELLVRNHIELYKQHLAEVRFNEFIKNRQLLHLAYFQAYSQADLQLLQSYEACTKRQRE